LFEAQQRAFAAHPYPKASERRMQLRGLKQQLSRYQDRLAQAISEDFGFRSTEGTRQLAAIKAIEARSTA
jgi:coniferyl-aldehyde dehydrogenase